MQAPIECGFQRALWIVEGLSVHRCKLESPFGVQNWTGLECTLAIAFESSVQKA